MVVAESVPCTIVDDNVVTPEIVVFSGTYRVLMDAYPDAVIFVNKPPDTVTLSDATILPCTSSAAVGAVVFPIASRRPDKSPYRNGVPAFDEYTIIVLGAAGPLYPVVFPR